MWPLAAAQERLCGLHHSARGLNAHPSSLSLSLSVLSVFRPHSLLDPALSARFEAVHS